MSQSVVAPRTSPSTANESSPPAVQTGSNNHLRWLRSAAPTAIVVTMLAGLAYWGHHTNWTLPKFSTLAGTSVSETDDWCVEHNVPESKCIECHPNLLPPGKDHGWCDEHGVAQCVLHHPEIAQLDEPAKISQEHFDQAERALALMPRGENNSRCKLHLKRIQFESPEAAEKVGIDIALAQEEPLVETITANGEIVYDQNHTAHLASRVAGVTRRVSAQVGDRVSKGDVIALVDAAEVGRAKSDFLQSISQRRLRQMNLDRLQPLASNGTIAGRQLREAEAAHQEAQIALLAAEQTLGNLGLAIHASEFAEQTPQEIAGRIQFLGIPEELATELGASTTTSNLFPLRSPLDGVVVERDVVEGESVDANKSLFTIADVSRMWLLLAVRQEDAKYVDVYQPVLFRPSDRATDAELKGKVSWISTSADEETRTVQVRVELSNDGALRANTFGAGRIVLREEPKAVVIPSEAVHWDGCCNVVFVRDKDYFEKGAPTFYHVRKVRLGVRDRERTEVIVGLLPGEVIASKNSVVLEAQLLKGNLGAGCCEAD